MGDSLFGISGHHSPPPSQTIYLLLLFNCGLSLSLPHQDAEKICTLERSEQNGEDCFYEPECEDVCNPVIVQDCRPVEEEHCKQVTYPNCSLVPEKKCRTVYDVKFVDSCSTEDVEVCEDQMTSACDSLQQTVCTKE